MSKANQNGGDFKMVIFSRWQPTLANQPVPSLLSKLSDQNNAIDLPNSQILRVCICELLKSKIKPKWQPFQDGRYFHQQIKIDRFVLFSLKERMK